VPICTQANLSICCVDIKIGFSVISGRQKQAVTDGVMVEVIQLVVLVAMVLSLHSWETQAKT
jgi:hypothetical protein